MACSRGCCRQIYVLMASSSSALMVATGPVATSHLAGGISPWALVVLDPISCVRVGRTFIVDSFSAPLDREEVLPPAGEWERRAPCSCFSVSLGLCPAMVFCDPEVCCVFVAKYIQCCCLTIDRPVESLGGSLNELIRYILEVGANMIRLIQINKPV